MIHVIAEIETVPGQRDQVLAEFRKLIPAVHAEQGCIEYGPTIDVATGIDALAPLREDVFTVIEKWESVDALKAHLAAPHMAEYRDKVAALVRDTIIRVVEPV